MGSLSDRIELLGGKNMPTVGLGVYKASPERDETYNAVRYALEAGYRHIDTASMYKNEREVGRAVRDSGIPREEVFITSKIWPTDFSAPKAAFEKSLAKMGLDYLDAYLLHWPGVDETLRFGTWEALLELAREKKLLVPGVSNFLPHHLKEISVRFGGVPPVNQIQLHPWHQQKETDAYCKENGIQIVSWGPIFHGHLEEEPLMAEIAGRYGVSPARATLRWHLKKGYAIIPKSVHKERIIENAQLFDFDLSGEDMRAIDALDGGKSFGFNEDTFDGNL